MSAWILLRGLTRESAHWGAFPALLRERVAPAEVLTLDLPGTGDSLHLASPARIDANVAACRARLAALGIAPPYRLVAMSLGAMVAIDWAQRHGDELACCVLINTSLRSLSPWHRRLRPASYGALLRVLLDAQARRRERTIWRLTSSRPPDDAVIAHWADIRRSRPVSAPNALRQLIAAARFRAAPHAPPVPVLVVAGDGDALVDPRCSSSLAQRWQAPLARHPTAGHDLALDDGPWLADRIAAWAAQTRA